MATSNQRDVRLGIEIETAGEESIQRLAAAVRGLAREGDPAAAEYARLANELDRLATQAGAVQGLQALRADVERLTASQREAAAAADRTSTAYGEQVATANALREAQAAARNELSQAKASYDDLKLAYQTIKNEGRAATETQAAYNARLREAKQVLDEQKRALESRKDTLREVNRETVAAESAERRLRTQFEQTTRASNNTLSALNAQATALQRLEQSAVGLGVDVNDLAAAEQRLLESTRRYVSEVGDRRREVSRDQAEADRLAAVQALALAEAQERGRVAAQSELAAIRDSEEFTRRYAAAQAEAAAAALAKAQAEERSAAASRAAAAAQAERVRQAEIEQKALLDAAEYTRILAAEVTRLEAAELQQAEAAQRTAVAARQQAEAQERAATAARNLAEAERQAGIEAEALRKAADYTRILAAEVAKLDAEADQAAAAQQRLADAAEAVNRAFGQTGVRSLQAIRAEMAGVNTSLTLLKRQFDAGAIGADDLARASSSAQVRLATLRRELQTIPSLPNVFEKVNDSINSLISRFGSLTAAIATVGFAVKPILDANIALESLRRTLTNVTGSASLANAQIEFLRTTANQAGLSVGQLANGFALFEASLLNSGQSLQTTQQLFQGVTSAAGTLGISSERVSNILLALGQVANKGKVSLEELQGQIGEALPGALKLAADSLGITTAELAGLLKEGKLLAEDFLPAFAQQLNTTFSTGAKPVEGLAQAFNRLKNAATQTAQQFADTSAYRALTQVLDATARNFDTLAAGAGSLLKAFLALKAIDIARDFLGIKAAAEAAAAGKLRDVAATTAQTTATRAQTAAIVAETAALATNTTARAANAAAGVASVGALGAISTGFGKVVTSAQAATSRLSAFAAAAGGPYGIALAAAIAFSEQLGNGIAYVGAKLNGSIDQLKRHEEQVRKDAEAVKASAAAYAEQARVVQESFIKIQVGFEKELAITENRIKVSEKLAKAKKEEGETSVKLAELTGNEALSKQVAAKAAGELEAATRSALAARQAEITLLEQERAALVAAAGAQENWSASRRAFFAEFDQNLEKKRADLELSKQQANAEGLLADKAFLTAQAYKDNSANLEALRLEVERAKGNVEALTAAFKEGFAIQEDVTQAARDLATAQGLLADAYEDATDAIKRRGEALKEGQVIAEKTVDLARKQIETDLKIAEATGNTIDKYQAQLKLKNLDIQASEQKISVATREAQLLREEAALLQQKLDLNDPLYAQKKREIDSILNAAKAKELEGQIERENLRGLNTELQLLDGTLKTTANNMGGFGAAARDAAEALDVFSEAGRRANNAANLSVLGKNVGKDGFVTGADGNRFSVNGQVNVPAGYVFDQEAFLRAQRSAVLSGLTAPDPADFYVAPPRGLDSTGIRMPDLPSFGAAKGGMTVKVEIGGRKAGAVKVASPADASALESVIRQVGEAARSGGFPSAGAGSY